MVCQLSPEDEQQGLRLPDTGVSAVKHLPAVQAWPGVPTHVRAEPTSARCLQGGLPANDVRNSLVGTATQSGQTPCNPEKCGRHRTVKQKTREASLFFFKSHAQNTGVGKMAQYLRIFAAFAEDAGSVLSTQVKHLTTVCNSSSGMTSRALAQTHTCTCVHMRTYAHKPDPFFKKRKSLKLNKH